MDNPWADSNRPSTNYFDNADIDPLSPDGIGIESLNSDSDPDNHRATSPADSGSPSRLGPGSNVHFSSASTAFGPASAPAPGRSQSIVSAINWPRERARLKSSRPSQLIDATHTWGILAAVGISVGIIAAAIDVASQWLSGLRFGRCRGAFYLNRDFCCMGIDPADSCPDWVPWAPTHPAAASFFVGFLVFVVLSTAFGSAAAVLVSQCAPAAKMSGIAEIKTMLGGYWFGDLLNFPTLAIKSIGLCLVVGAGLWVGKEGPLVHVACCVAAIAIQLSPVVRQNEARKREVLSAAAAAGISVAFGAPIGGVLFTLEKLAYYTTDRVMWQSFVCAMVAAVSLQSMNPFRTGQLVLFQVSFDRQWHKFELVPFAAIGALGGLYGAGITFLNTKIARWRMSTPWAVDNPVFEVVAASLATAIVNFPDIYSRIQSSVLLSYLFRECDPSAVPGDLCAVSHWFTTFVLLVLAVVIGVALTAYSFGMAIPAGMLMPSMLVGALGGRAVGVFTQALHHYLPHAFIFRSCPAEGTCITPGVYGLVGAASALTGATRLTITTVVIMFELTGALSYVLPIMIGVMVSKWVSESWSEYGIYESWIHLKEYPLLDRLEEVSIPYVRATQFMTPVSDLIVLTVESTVGQLEQALEDTSIERGFPIVQSRDTMMFVGYISRDDLLSLSGVLRGSGSSDSVGHGKLCFKVPAGMQLDPDVFDASQYAELSPLTLSSSSTLYLSASYLQRMGLKHLIFTNRGRLAGLVTRNDIYALLRSSKERESLEEARDLYDEARPFDEVRLLSDRD